MPEPPAAMRERAEKYLDAHMTIQVVSSGPCADHEYWQIVESVRANEGTPPTVRRDVLTRLLAGFATEIAQPSSEKIEAVAKRICVITGTSHLKLEPKIVETIKRGFLREELGGGDK